MKLCIMVSYYVAGINFNVRVKFTAYDLRQVSSASDTITGDVDPFTDGTSTLAPTGANAIGLNANGQLTMTGSTQLTLATTDCTTVR